LQSWNHGWRTEETLASQVAAWNESINGSNRVKMKQKWLCGTGKGICWDALACWCTKETVLFFRLVHFAHS
jgi:hypothetical protein